MIEIVTPRYSPVELDRLYKQQWIRRGFIKAEGFRILRSPSPEFRTEDGKFVAKLVSGVFSASEQKRRADAWAGISGSLGNRPPVFPKDARMRKLRKDGKPTGRIGVPEDIVRAAKGQAITLGYDHEPKRHNGRWLGKMTPDTHRYPDLFGTACVDAVRLSEVFKRELPAEYAKQLAAYNLVHPDWRIADTVFTSIYGITMATACHVDGNDHPDGIGVITASGLWSGSEFIVPDLALGFDMRPGDALYVDVHRLHGNLQRISGHRVGQVHFIRSGMEECLGLDRMAS